MWDMAEDEDVPIHVMPMFGRAHETSAECWCSPMLDNADAYKRGEHASLLYVHRVLH